MMAAEAGSLGRYSPASLSSTFTSSMSETLSHFEMMYAVMHSRPYCSCASAAAWTMASSERVSSE